VTHKYSKSFFTVLAVILCAAAPMLAQISIVKVTGGAVEGVVKDGIASELILSCWINFAKKGNPNGPGLPVWPAFDEKEQMTMFFDKTPCARPHPNVDKIKAFDAHFAKLREDAKAKK
jgi:hypothetical protein